MLHLLTLQGSQSSLEIHWSRIGSDLLDGVDINTLPQLSAARRQESLERLGEIRSQLTASAASVKESVAEDVDRLVNSAGAAILDAARAGDPEPLHLNYVGWG